MTDVTLFLHDMAHGGEAVGRHEGKAVFVAGGIPGERVRVRITEDRARYARAQLLEVVEPSSHRASPPCPYFCRCGGCHWQHIGYEAQLRLKEDIVRSLLQRVGGQADPRVLPTVSMMHPWAYRNHVQLIVEGGRIGYHAAQSHELVPVDRCLIAHPLLDSLWPILQGMPPGLQRISLRAGAATGERMVLFEGAPPPRDLARRLAQQSVSCVSMSGGGRVTALS
ncbi:MAG: class I SAM-dependent RNA methyltransferase, partial [Chloroflexi bacterium]|nr:class I SAM-dependent RNA methyltransferase [Chloroflexota bacterium]